MSSAQLRPDLPDPVPSTPAPSAAESRPKGHAWIWLLIGAALIAGTVQWGRRAAQPNEGKAGIPIRTAKVRTGRLERTIRLTGMAVAEKAAVLNAPLLLGNRADGDYTQTIRELVPNGATVKKGDKVAEFDRLYMLLQLDDYEAIVTAYERYLPVLDARLDVVRTAQTRKIARAKGAWDKAVLDLRTAPVRSEIQIEKYRLVGEEMKSRYDEYLVQDEYLELSEGSAVRSLELALRAWRLRTQRIRDNVEKMAVRAPINGLVVISTLFRGTGNAVLETGDRMYPGQPLMQIVDAQSLVVSAAVNQADADLLRVGEKARIHVDAYPDIDLPGHVSSIGAFARMGTYRRSFLSEVPVRLKFDKLDDRIIPNFSASADVVIEARDSTIVVPRECVFEEPGGLKHIAFTRNGDNWERREIEVGLQSNIAAEVISGLRSGEEVATERVPAAALAAQ